jgi:hypothetical protein
VLYDLKADDVAEYFAVEPHGLAGMTKADGARGRDPPSGCGSILICCRNQTKGSRDE